MAARAEVETRLVIDGQAATAILAEAHDGQDTLIALVTHGRSGVARLLLGSVARTVITWRGCAGAGVPTAKRTHVMEEKRSWLRKPTM